MIDVRDVVARLGALEQFMRRYRVNTWADEFLQVQQTAASDRQELKRRVLDLYRGSMGSLTDLIVSRVNGHEVDDEAAANAELDRMVQELWEMVKGL
jgi:hypothetical protein